MCIAIDLSRLLIALFTKVFRVVAFYVSSFCHFERVRNEVNILMQLQLSNYISHQRSMMKKYLQRLCAVFSLCWLLSSQCSAAVNGVGVTLINYTFDTVGFGYTITINAQVTNYDTLAFAGNIDFGLKNSSYNLTTASLFNKPPYSSSFISLYPNETVPAVFSIDIDPQYFIPGPDVVVVWPICTGPIADSVLIEIFVETPNSIKDERNDLFAYIIMPDRIFLKNYRAATNIEQVRIFNLMGQQVAELNGNYISEVPVPNLPKGLYLCEFTTADKRRQVIKFLK